MNGVYKLQNTMKHYEWGSASYIPELLGLENIGRKPYAEMWMGTHPGGPSFATRGAGAEPLSSISGELPFLLKLLAAEKPLSIQAHPDKAQAEAGYAEENARRIPPDAPERSFKDPNHKPEIICALTPFRALCGFRQPDEIKRRLSLFPCPAVKKLLRPLAANGGALKMFLAALFDLSLYERAELLECIKQNIGNMQDGQPQYAGELEVTECLASIFPSDTAVLSPLYLNVVELAAGEAIFVPAGVLHAYIHGAGVELMAASDNVIRGGLTAKRIDRAGLFGIVRFAPFHPSVYEPHDAAFYEYAAPYGGFSLYRIKSAETAFPVSGASILVCTAGAIRFRFNDGGILTVRCGESVFIAPAAHGSFLLSGDFEAFAAGNQV